MTPAIVERIRENTRQVIRSVLPSFRLNATGNPAKWAKAKRYLFRGESPLSTEQNIKFTFDNSPWCEEPCMAAVDPEVQLVVLWFGSNMGKTGAVGLNVLGWVIDECPGNFIWALKTQGQMDDISKKMIGPSLDASPSVASKIAPAKSRDSGNTIAMKLFANGSLSMIGMESVTGIRANRTPYIFADEIDSWGPYLGDEGDPLAGLLRRSDGFSQSIRIIASTGTVKGHSRIEHWYQKSDQKKWLVPCLTCGHEQIITFGQIRWPKGRYQEARWHCLKCDHAHDDAQRRKSVRNGSWRGEAAFHGIRGYWINGFNSLMPANKGFKDRLHQWAQEVSEASHATDPTEAKKVIVQTLFTETWQDEEDMKPEWAEIAARREKWTAIPKKVCFLTVGVDVHPDRIEATLDGWGRGEENWTLEHAIFLGDPREPEVWGRLEAWVLLARQREDTATMIVRAVGVDTGHPPTQRMAYAFIRPRQARNWFAFKGSSLVDAPVIVRPKKSTTVDRVSLLTVGGHRVKGLIYDRVSIQSTATPGFMHFHESLSDVWFQQLLSEDSSPVWKNGVRFREFKKPTMTTRNEALDTKSYSYCALCALGPLSFDQEDMRLLSEIEERKKKEENVIEQETWTSPMRTGGGFVGGQGFRI